ncbi:hypothetical protein H6F32_06600 [Anabaena sp. FACHB-1237]|uniref:hypothetical protein n=1 Tax=Anabaena sp. FACHB-1237 TaxID=2692769 RepID=UPI00168054E3|nr:hypothetical protein [Anabaena sp. FACHB-1237]MBD2137263.1 hypothetical protein [Anabaena sp. FACHB-1237]
MMILKKIPWFSLSLVLLTYTALGWVISDTKPPVYIWIVTVVCTLIFVSFLTNVFSKISNYTNVLFKTNFRTFGVTVLAAFLFFLMIAWFKVFLDTLLILSATVLAKIDFQTANLNKQYTFLLTSLSSLLGLVLGIFIHYRISNV